MTAPELVVVGASWGGTEALGILLEGLPADFDVPIAIVQHRSPESGEGSLAALLQSCSRRAVREVEDKDPIEPGGVYLAPPDYHLLVEPGAFALSVDASVRGSRPSIDVLFESAADAYGPAVVGVVLTGANEDGGAGLARIKERGGLAIVQDPADAAKAVMPQAAIAAVEPDAILPLAEIAPFLVELCVGSRAGAGGSRT